MNILDAIARLIGYTILIPFFILVCAGIVRFFFTTFDTWRMNRKVKGNPDNLKVGMQMCLPSLSYSEYAYFGKDLEVIIVGPGYEKEGMRWWELRVADCENVVDIGSFFRRAKDLKPSRKK